MNNIKIGDKIQIDEPTKKWFEKQPDYMVTTVRQCEKCGLFYKPSLGHKCKKGGEADELMELYDGLEDKGLVIPVDVVIQNIKDMPAEGVRK